MAYTGESCGCVVAARGSGGAVFALASALAALAAGTASAHAPPQIVDVVPREGTGPLFVSNRGLILADSDEGPFRLLCTEATKTNTSEKPDVLALPDGRLILATSRGLIRSSDGGCSFESVEPFGELLVPAAAADPEDALHFYVAAFDASRGGLFETTDGGESFTPLQPPSDSDFIATILIAPSRPSRLYLDGQLIGDGTITPYVAVSDDGGASFERFELTLLPTEAGFELLAVSPTDPDVLVGRAADADTVALQDRLLVSRDRGQTWTSPLGVHAMTEARFSEDGSTLWATGVDGAFRSDDAFGSFEQLPGATRISLALEHQGELWICGHYDGMLDGVAAIGREGAIRTVMAFTDVTQPVACDPTAPSTIACTNLWRDWQRELLSIQPDGGTPGPSPDAGVTMAGKGGDLAGPGLGARAPSSGGGCNVERVANRSGLGSAAAVAALAVAFGRLRRRRRDFSRIRDCARLARSSRISHALTARLDADRS